jgi:hypothetical protein
MTSSRLSTWAFALNRGHGVSDRVPVGAVAAAVWGVLDNPLRAHRQQRITVGRAPNEQQQWWAEPPTSNNKGAVQWRRRAQRTPAH